MEAIKEKPTVNIANEDAWLSIINQFPLNKSLIHLGTSQFLSSHSTPVREAIQHYAKYLDDDPVNHTMKSEMRLMDEVRDKVNEYFQVGEPQNIAMTDSTTMGLGVLYAGFKLKPGDEVLTTEHDHYAHHESIYHATARAGARFKKVRLFSDIDAVCAEEIIENLINAITEETRLVGITWVHSNTGLKIPVAEICAAIQEVNSQRDGSEQIKVIVDGVHGFGIEMETFKDLACDFFVASGHKWIYGPRGTGFVAGRGDAWQKVTPVIATYTDVMENLIEGERPKFMDGKQMTPGGFHSLEYRWALKDAVDFMLSIGKQQVYDRVHSLNRQCKDGLKKMKHVKVHTPWSDELSSGIIAFEVEGMPTKTVVKRLFEKNIVATAAPYKVSYARFTPGIINTPHDVEQALAAVNDLR
jgi:isopenicillin-N epimerase